MNELIEQIQRLTEEELHQLMRAINLRIARDHPELDVVYAAIHKDPDLQEVDLAELVHFLEQDLPWHREPPEGTGIPQ